MLQESKRQKAFLQWHGHGVSARAEIGLPEKRQPWNEISPVPCIGVSANDRVKDFMTVAFWQAHTKHADISLDGLPSLLWLNLCQGVQLKAFSFGGPGTWTRNGFWFHYGSKVVLSGECMLQLLGWPRACSSAMKFSDSDCRQLAGDGYILPICGAIGMLLFLKPWRP